MEEQGILQEMCTRGGNLGNRGILSTTRGHGTLLTLIFPHSVFPQATTYAFIAVLSIKDRDNFVVISSHTSSTIRFY